MLSFSLYSSSSSALFFWRSSWTVRSRLRELLRSVISRSRRSICSFVLARIARWASLSLARLRSSCEGVKLDTLLVPVWGSQVSHAAAWGASRGRHGSSNNSNISSEDIPFFLLAPLASTEGDRGMMRW